MTSNGSKYRIAAKKIAQRLLIMLLSFGMATLMIFAGCGLYKVSSRGFSKGEFEYKTDEVDERVEEKKEAVVAEPAQAKGTISGALHSPRIVIIKHKKRLYLYESDRLVKSYPVIVGKNSGTKKKRGDYKTPEGDFYICTRNDRSNYYLALGLSYPAPDDANRALKKRIISRKQHEQIVTAHRLQRQPSWRTRLGGAIMIHGVAKGRMDTNGCIALRNNEHMKELWDQLPHGSPVKILP